MKWSTLSQNDFYFWVNPQKVFQDGETMIVIVPINYFKKNPDKCMLQELNIPNLVPSDFLELGEGIFLSFKTPEDLKRELLNLGFKESSKFEDQCRNDFTKQTN